VLDPYLDARRLGAGGRALAGCRGASADRLRGLGRRGDAGTRLIHGGAHSPAKDSGVTIRIRYHIPNARLAVGAVSAGQGGGVDQAYDGWRVVSQFAVPIQRN
jgi:hypothetical protein